MLGPFLYQERFELVHHLLKTACRRLSRLCGYKASLYRATTGFQSLITWCFVSCYAIFAIDRGEPCRIETITRDMQEAKMSAVPEVCSIVHFGSDCKDISAVMRQSLHFRLEFSGSSGLNMLNCFNDDLQSLLYKAIQPKLSPQDSLNRIKACKHWYEKVLGILGLNSA